jgi:hypothetical protein
MTKSQVKKLHPVIERFTAAALIIHVTTRRNLGLEIFLNYNPIKAIRRVTAVIPFSSEAGIGPTSLVHS